MTTKPIPFVILLLALLRNGVCISGCMESERNDLLDFKRGLRDDANRLSSWSGKDCCDWEGIACSNKSGHVIWLDLHNPHPFSDSDDQSYNRWSLGGDLRPSLLGLKHLRYLDLSMNNFEGSHIPEFIGSVLNLRYLNLSQAGLGGLVPHELGNLSRLQYLDLHNNPLNNDPQLSIDDALWLSGLSSMQHLIMNNVRFQNASNLLQALNMLPSVVEIRLRSCEIDSISLSLPHVNFTHLSTLDLFDNRINSTLPSWLFNISSLEYLDLSYNSFQGSVPVTIENLDSLKVLLLSSNKLQSGIPKELGKLCKLRTLSLFDNNISRSLPGLGDVFSGCIKTSIENLDLSITGLTGYLPDWLGEVRLLKSLYLDRNSLVGSLPESLVRLTSLQELSLSYNGLNGSIPESFGGLVEIVYLDISVNLLEGIVSEAHLANLTKLTDLDLSSNRLILKVSPNWVPLFQLYSLRMSSCILGPKFPAWIRSQENISSLVLSNVGIEDTMPDWFWKSFFQVAWLDLSENAISGRLPDLVDFVNCSGLNLRSNYFYGSLPNFSQILVKLDLSDNLFSGLIDPAIGKRMPKLQYLTLSGNNLHGDVPPSLCELQEVQSLDLSRNLLSGELPNCWKHFSLYGLFLTVLDFSNNNLSGGIPDTIGSLPLLKALHLSNNSLSGVIPLSLKGCTGLIVLDLSQNNFTGKIPQWIGETNLSLKILSLRSNMFVGRIPRNLSRIPGLQILDLAHNNLSGKIPKSFRNFAGMKVARAYMELIMPIFASWYEENLEVVMKGTSLVYGDSNGILSLVTALDLSDNNLSGMIPRELGRLAGLLSLNLSRNHLSTEIPNEIGSMQSLMSLDLSRNNLSGTIPSTMVSLTSLSYLDLSRNNLSGRIPSGNQFQTFIESSYVGNPGLCGFPVKQICEDGKVVTGNNTVIEDEDYSKTWWFYLGMGQGFVVGFCILLGTLLLKNSWKYTFLRCVDRLYEWFCIIVTVSFSRV